jgi:hypothetical protein
MILNFNKEFLGNLKKKLILNLKKLILLTDFDKIFSENSRIKSFYIKSLLGAFSSPIISK